MTLLCNKFKISIFTLFLISALLYAADAKTKRVVRVGYYTLDNFQEYDKKTNSYRGYSYDYMLAIAQYANWEYEFIPVTFEDGLQKVEDGTLDLINGIQNTPELSQHLVFSSIPSGESCTCLVVPLENKSVAYEDFDSFAKLTVGLDYQSNLNNGFVEYCKDNDCMPTFVYYHLNENVQHGLKQGEIDACLVSNMQNVNMRTVSKFDTRSYYFATTKSNIALIQELNSAMNILETKDPYCAEKIYSKYHRNSASQPTVISNNERLFISSNPTYIVAYDPAWYPFSYKDKNGNFKGAMAKLFARISKDTGIQFTYICGDTTAQSLALLSSGIAKIYAGFPYDYTWAKRHNALITEPFLSLTTFSISNKNNNVQESYAINNHSYYGYLTGTIKRDAYYSVNYDSIEDCLNAVNSQKQDVTFVDSYQLGYYEKLYKFRNLDYKVCTPDNYNLSIAISNSSDRMLYSIIEKEIAAIGSDEITDFLKESSTEIESHKIQDLLYSNQQIASIFYIIIGFILAILVCVSITMRHAHRKNKQLEAATNAKSVFLSNISHDMRTPLNGIIGYTDLALDENDKSKVSDYLSKIKISGHLLLDLINDTLDISKIESGKYVLNPESVNNEELLESIIVPIRETAQKKHIHFIVETDKLKTGTIKIDRLNMQKIVLNLLSNAIKFTPEGGTVTLTIANCDIKDNGCNTIIIVKDTGIGIRKEFLPKLYEPFTQDRTPQSREAVGTGLGLSIVKAIITLMNGHIDVQTEQGKGTTFTVYLPIEYTAEVEQKHDVEQVDKTVLAGRNALLCEDNYMNSEIATTILKQFGMNVVAAENGRIGIDIFSSSPENSFDVILMDLRMPVLDGYSAAEAIRKLPRKDAGTIPIIAMSADAYESDIAKCKEKGMTGHLSKPIDRTTLFEELVKQCKKREN